MKFTVDRSTFIDGIQKTLGIVERRTTIPILNNILIETHDDCIRISATDREIGLIADYDATIETPGSITVPAKKLHEMIREIDGERISFSLQDNNRIDITCEQVAFRIPGIGADEFPALEESLPQDFCEMSTPLFRDMVGKTYFAISLDEMRPTLSGVCFTLKDGEMEMVSTDGHRLALSRKTSDSVPGGHEIHGIIIPRKGVLEIKKLLESCDDVVRMAVNEKTFFLQTNRTLLRINLIDGVYPDYQKVLPTDDGIVLTVDRKQILHALRRMSVMSSDRFSGVKIKLENNKMSLDSTNPDVGEAHDEITVDYAGDMFEVGYNVRYLIDAIDVISNDEIIFEARKERGPGVIRPAGNDGYMCVVMPIKIRKD